MNTSLSGLVQVSGNGYLVDENDNVIATGTWNGGVTVINSTNSALVDSSIQKEAQKIKNTVLGS